MATSLESSEISRPAASPGAHIANVIRGGLIGTAEVIPGVSGGTVALVTGIYENIISSGGHIVTALRMLLTDLPRGRGAARAVAEVKQAHWPLLLAVAAGMLAGLLLTAQVAERMLEDYPRHSLALFLGLVLASVWVPYSLSGGRWHAKEWAAAALATAAAFALTGLPPSEVSPTPLVILPAAAVAVCALALPGVSGSFFLLTVGLYGPTVAAVNDRDLAYLAVFAAGAAIGLALFVKALQWLLEHHHRMTLVVMSGLMVGSLRALWPWQGDGRELQAPAADVLSVSALFLVGIVCVTMIILVERRIQSRQRDAGGIRL
jgi:putative membrane protein